MNILVPDNYRYTFIILLKNKMIKDIKRIIKLKRRSLIDMDLYLNDTFEFEETTLAKDIMLFALDNIEIIKRTKYYSIEINRNIDYPNTSIKLITLIQLINYGNLDIKGVPIFINEFKEVNKELKRLYKVYKRIGVVL